eukprot:259005_1
MSQHSSQTHLKSILAACGMRKHMNSLKQNGFSSIVALSLLNIEDHYQHLNVPSGIMPIGELSIIIQQIRIYSDSLKSSNNESKIIKVDIEPKREVIVLSDDDDDDIVCCEMKQETEQTCNGSRNDSNKRKRKNANKRKDHTSESMFNGIGTRVIPPLESCVKPSSTNNTLQLDNHIRIHIRERPYQCSHDGCGKAFLSHGNLTQHLRVHSDERAYECSYNNCHKKFKHKGSLVRHIKQHAGERPYKCSYDGCDRAFIEAYCLKRHIRSHTGEKPYQCKICKKRFSYWETRSNHIKTVHKNS